MLSLSSLAYRCIATDLRVQGGTDAPASSSLYTSLHVAGDLVGLLDSLGIGKGCSYGAIIAWDFCKFRLDRIKALVNTSLPCKPRDPKMKPAALYRAALGDDFYMSRFQMTDDFFSPETLIFAMLLMEPGDIEEEDFSQAGTEKIIKVLLAFRETEPLCVPKEVGFRSFPEPPRLPIWVSEEDVNYYASNFNQTGFTGGLNHYRAMDLTWELTAPWTGVQIQVPTKFIVGDQDLTYHLPGSKEYVQSRGMKKHVPSLEEVVVLKGVAHFLDQEKPEEVTQHIHDFIKKF